MKTAFRRGVEGLVAAATAAAMTLSFASPSQGSTAVVDVQQTTFFNAQGSFQVMAQTFTAGTTAQLVGVSLPFITTWGMIEIGIQGVDSSQQPNGTFLTSQYWSGSQPSSRQFYDFNLSQPQ